jgi:PhoPQ-activated pathogenicity-related protein
LSVAVAGCAHMAADRPKGPVSTARETANPTALDRYMAKPDPTYQYKLVSTFEGQDTTGYVIELTSQTWRTAQEVDLPVWKHWLTIAVPKKVTSPTAMILIGGGSNTSAAPKGGDVTLHRVAREAGAITAQISTIPSEPLVFTDEGKRRSEDSIIAYTWDKYMRTGDEEWPLRLPMTKAVVRAMDTIQAFCASPEGGGHKVETFMVTGASKRGWTTWTTSAVDNRVIAMCPIVIDVLNVVPSFHHHKAVYGDWAPAVGDYVRMHVMDWLDTPEFASLLKIVDPYSYVGRLTIPKLVMNSCGDQFFCPDSWQFYWNDLKGPSYLRYVPNTGHGLNASAVQSVESFFVAIVKGAAIPQYSWSFPDEATTRVETKSKPTSVKLWQAENPNARDFRIDTIGEAWKATDLAPQSDGVYVGHVEKPEKGWRAYMVELTFPGAGAAPFIFTSPVRIVPDVLPNKYEPCPNPEKGFLSK